MKWIWASVICGIIGWIFYGIVMLVGIATKTLH